MTYFTRIGNDFRATDTIPKSSKKLEPFTYSLERDDLGFYLSIVDDFTLPSKIYGDSNSLKDKIIHTYKTREKPTGVLLLGEKGSGKTLLTKSISIELQKQGFPIILVNYPHSGDCFNSFLQDIKQECVVLFDEFEKVYSRSQENLLTVLDGVFSSRKLFLLTANKNSEISEFLKNRPSRIYYNISYDGLSAKSINEYVDENIINIERANDAKFIYFTQNVVNFDMLSSIVEEINRYDVGYNEAVKILNVCDKKNINYLDVTIEIKKLKYKSFTSSDFLFKNTLVIGNGPKIGKSPSPSLSFTFNNRHVGGNKSNPNNIEFKESYEFGTENITKFDIEKGEFEVQLDDDIKLTFNR